MLSIKMMRLFSMVRAEPDTKATLKMRNIHDGFGLSAIDAAKPASAGKPSQANVPEIDEDAPLAGY